MKRDRVQNLSDLPLVPRIVIGVVGLCIGVGLLYTMALEVVPVVRGALGAGQAGTLELERKVCVKGMCGWEGTYVAHDGSARLPGREFYGDLPESAAKGDKVVALDTGSPTRVYSTDGSWGWVGAVFVALIFGLAFTAVGAALPFQRRRPSG